MTLILIACGLSSVIMFGLFFILPLVDRVSANAGETRRAPQSQPAITTRPLGRREVVAR